MAALLVAMTGCQKEPQMGSEGTDANAKAYVSLKINLPTEVGRRAEGFDDGEAKEYSVNDVTLVFFNAGEKVVFTKVETPAPWAENGATDITTTAQTAAIDVTGMNVKSVLVLVNNVLGADKIAVEKSYDEVNAELTGAPDLTGSGNAFFMSNAPYLNGSEIVTLVDVATFDTATKALETPATVQVERAVAKVEMGTAVDTPLEVRNTAGDQVIGTFKMKGWMLDNTNTTTYPVRKCDYAAWHDGPNWLNKGFYYGTGSKRIHYAVDPNYNATATLATTTTFTAVGGDIAYCLENTFTTDYQKETNTTRVIIKALYTPTGFTEGETWFRVGSAQVAYKKAEFIALLQANSDVADATIETAVNNYTAGTVDFSTLDVNLSTVLGNVLCYEDGVCYYQVLIRHFDDEELGYTTSGAGSFNETYTGTYKASDLGRYSVVRNNWYKLTVKKVSQVGTPEIETPEDVNDDVKKQYLSCKIDILAWAMRNQNVEL